MAKRKRSSATPATRILWEYSLGCMTFIDDTPIHKVIDTLRDLVLGALLVVRHGVSSDVPIEDLIECEYFFIGHSQERYYGRSRVKVTYQIVRPVSASRRKSQRNLSRRRNLYAWIGRGSTGGISLYWRERRPV